MYAIFKLAWALEVSILIGVFRGDAFRYTHFYKYSKSRGAVNRAVRSLRHQDMIDKDEQNNYYCTKKGKKVVPILTELRSLLKKAPRSTSNRRRGEAGKL